MAYDQIQVYPEHQLATVKRVHSPIQRSMLKWTGSTTSLIELVYGLCRTGIINNGNIDIKEIARTFEELFGPKLGNFYHTYL